MQYIVLIAQLLLATVSLAAPTPPTDQGHFVPGDIVKGKPKHFEHPMPGTNGVGHHPLVVLSHPDPDGWVQVTPLSHAHPMNPPTKPASTYGLPIDPIKGESSVNVAGPNRIQHKNLRPVHPPERMTVHHFAALKAEINKNCPGALTRRNGPNPCDRKAMRDAAIEHEKKKHEMKDKRQSDKIRAMQGGPSSHHNHPVAGPSHGAHSNASRKGRIYRPKSRAGPSSRGSPRRRP